MEINKVNFEIEEEDPLGVGTVLLGHTFEYYGWLASNGLWVIMQGNTTTATSLVTWRYYGGRGGYTGLATAWAARDGYTYKTLEQVADDL